MSKEELIINELIRTELTYINQLNITIDVFLYPLSLWVKDLQLQSNVLSLNSDNHKSILDIVVLNQRSENLIDELFGNIQLIYNYNKG